MNKIQKTYIEAELKEQEIKIYSRVKHDMEFIAAEIEKHGLDIIKHYISGVDKKIKRLEEKDKNA